MDIIKNVLLRVDRFKVSPSMLDEELVRLLNGKSRIFFVMLLNNGQILMLHFHFSFDVVVNPNKELGRVTLIQLSSLDTMLTTSRCVFLLLATYTYRSFLPSFFFSNLEWFSKNKPPKPLLFFHPPSNPCPLDLISFHQLLCNTFRLHAPVFANMLSSRVNKNVIFVLSGFYVFLPLLNASSFLPHFLVLFFCLKYELLHWLMITFPDILVWLHKWSGHPVAWICDLMHGKWVQARFFLCLLPLILFGVSFVDYLPNLWRMMYPWERERSEVIDGYLLCRNFKSLFCAVWIYVARVLWLL